MATHSSNLPQFTSREVIVGWRGWNIIHPHFLHTNNTIWLPGERCEAICTARWHEESERIPVACCTCGIYAFTSPYEVKQQGYASQTLLGEVYLWGKVVEHEKGYKAEYAYPKSFFAKSEALFREDRTNVPSNFHRASDEVQYRKYIQLAEFVAFRYNVPLEVVDKTHALYTITEAERQRQAEVERKQRLAIAQEKAQRRKKNDAMKAAAMRLPPTIVGCGYKTLWDQICAEADEAVRAKLDHKKGGL